MSDRIETNGGGAREGVERAVIGRSAAAPDRGHMSAEGPGRSGSERGGEGAPAPPWLDEAASDFGAPQAVIDALVVQLGFQGMARLIADRPAFRAALIAEYRRQCGHLRERLLREEWRR